MQFLAERVRHALWTLFRLSQITSGLLSDHQPCSYPRHICCSHGLKPRLRAQFCVSVWTLLRATLYHSQITCTITSQTQTSPDCRWSRLKVQTKQHANGTFRCRQHKFGRIAVMLTNPLATACLYVPSRDSRLGSKINCKMIFMLLCKAGGAASYAISDAHMQQDHVNVHQHLFHLGTAS